MREGEDHTYRRDMKKTALTEAEEFERFLETMARVLGIPTEQLERIVFQGQRKRMSQRRGQRRTARRNHGSLSL